MRRIRGSLSIRLKILLLFILSLLVTVGCFAYIIFSRWTVSAGGLIKKATESINMNIYDEVLSYVQLPFQINEMSRNIIEQGLADISDQDERSRFFAWILDAYNEDISSLGFASAGGEYDAARRNERGEIEIVKNDADTSGHNWYYALREDYSAGELVSRGSVYDGKTRAWYIRAAEGGEPIYTTVLNRYLNGEMTLSAAHPIYDASDELLGVLATHLQLDDISDYLKKIVETYQGIAFIIEESTHELIANSMDLPNYLLREDGSVRRFEMLDIEDENVQKVYRQYLLDKQTRDVFRGDGEEYFVNAQPLRLAGISWIVVSAIPKSLFTGDVYAAMRLAGAVASLSLLLGILVYSLVIRRTLKPIHALLDVTHDLSRGKLSSRVENNRKDELGLISDAVNNVAEKIEGLVNNLEAQVQQRTEDLNAAVTALEESKKNLLLILDTAAEGIYGINLEGACTFCNTSCLKMLGYSDYKDLLKHSMHEMIHHTREDGSPLPENDCQIILALKRGEKVHAEDEVFWRADGSPFSVEYYSYPQIKDGQVIGAVVTFMDITERKKKEAQIRYLSCYDPLTGLHNRRCFDENRVMIDTESNLPLSVIFADLNGLKMTNDIFGHAAGDELIRISSQILKSACRHEDLIARIGGDEFIILLPRTNISNAMKVLSRIRECFTDVQVKAVKGSISLGLSVKTGADQPLDEVMANAENAMYKDKSVNRKNNSKDMINTIVDTLHTKNSREKRHSLAVADLSERIGSAMNLPDDQLVKLRQAGYLHDIGKIILPDSILAKDTFTAEEIEAIRQHPAAGYRILSLFDDMLDIAEFVYGHHERWDGTGFPRGIKGEQMPLISRIIAVAEVYDRIAHKGGLQPEGFEESALEAIRKGAGRQFDPKVAETFLRIMADSEEEV